MIIINIWHYETISHYAAILLNSKERTYIITYVNAALTVLELKTNFDTFTSLKPSIKVIHCNATQPEIFEKALRIDRCVLIYIRVSFLLHKCPSADTETTEP